MTTTDRGIRHDPAPNPAASPAAIIKALLASHGAPRLLAALAAALLRGRLRRTHPPDAAHLGAHLRRDIGLPPTEAPRPLWPR